LLKSTYTQVWKNYPEELKHTVQYQFRDKEQTVSWILRYWQLVNGNFVPQHKRFGKFFDSSLPNLKAIQQAITRGKYKVICLNDNEQIEYAEYVKIKEAIISAFDGVFPKPSTFEME
jgi:hypothetical protein